mmetsp:Transcript_5538/g.8706  ORF Transcript_5538/g.8706 Transcript_5538/m.8706 type:complete len:129 (-) Transcript_5538:47-433(-)
MKIQEGLTYTKQLMGALKHTLTKRKEHIMSRLTKTVEKKKEADQKKMLGGWLDFFWSCLGYTVMALIILSIAVPLFIINYVRTNVHSGEWVMVSNSTMGGVNGTDYVDLQGGKFGKNMADTEEDFGDD